MVSAPPVLLDGNGDINSDVRKVAVQLGNISSFSQMIYSVTPVSITLTRSAPLNNKRLISYTHDISQTRVLLTVFHEIVNVDGFFRCHNV